MAVNEAEKLLGWLNDDFQNINITHAVPTELPIVEVRQGFLDFAWELDDRTFFHIEFQSSKEPDLYRFLLYDAHLSNRYRRSVRTAVLYTDGVKAAPDEMDLGGLRYRVDNIYLSERDGDAAIIRLEQHIDAGTWTADDRMELVFLAHMGHQSRTQEEMWQKVRDLTLRLPDEAERSWIAIRVLGLSGRGIWNSESELLKEVLRTMIDLASQVLEEAFEQVEGKGFEKGIEKGRVEGLTEGRLQEKLELAKRLLEMGDSVEKVSIVTGLPLEEVQRLLAH